MTTASDGDNKEGDKRLQFDLQATDGRARRGRVTVAHGSFDTPAFMPVGTRGSVKGLAPRDLAETGSQICLGNTYHLDLAPGAAVVEKMGGLHGFMAWDRPILTDSGGYQVFSLPKVDIDEEGVTFEFEKGGQAVTLTPEKSMAIQKSLGADIIMAFDHVVAHPASHHDAQDAVYRSARWLERCAKVELKAHQNLFGIIQGSTYSDLRSLSVQMTCALDLPGFAIGGLSVGEGHELMMESIDQTEPYMPEDKPRYLMGVGYPEDIIEAVARGVDMFDCVIPTRYARSGVVFTRRGRMRVTNRRYRSDKFPLDTNCNCYACRKFTRAYVHHLINAKEILGSTLATLHNVTFYQDLMRTIRQAIEAGVFQAFRLAFLDEYLSTEKRRELGMENMLKDIDRQGLPWNTEHSCIAPTPVVKNREEAGRSEPIQSPKDRIAERKELAED